jgi:hypothetical protein
MTTLCPEGRNARQPIRAAKVICHHAPTVIAPIQIAPAIADEIAELFVPLTVTVRSSSSNEQNWKLAERVGIFEIVFPSLSNSCRWFPSSSDSAA